MLNGSPRGKETTCLKTILGHPSIISSSDYFLSKVPKFRQYIIGHPTQREQGTQAQQLY